MNTKIIQTRAFQALKKAVKGVVKQHQKSGRPIIVWKNNKVKYVQLNPPKKAQEKMVYLIGWIIIVLLFVGTAVYMLIEG